MSDLEHIKDENKKLKEKIKRLEEENERLKKVEREFEEFKALHSHTVGELRKALKIKPDKVKSGLPLGAPKGHKGYSRHVPERFDQVKELNPKKCYACGTKLSDTQEIRERCVTDIKLVLKVKNTLYKIHRKYCVGCKKLVEQPVPNVLPHARFGLNLMLFVMYLKLGLALPGNKVCELLKTMYDLSISEAEIVVILKQLANAFGDYYSYLEKIVKLARVKHSDTTSWRVNGRNYFAWTFIAAGIVLYKIRKRNNARVAMSFFGRDQKNKVLVVDRHSVFRSLAEKLGFILQLCWSHILQDTKELARDFGNEGKYLHRKLKEIYSMAKSFDHKGKKEQVDQLKAEILQITQRNYKHSKIRKFVNNLYHRDAENLFRFVTDPEIPSTNNISERELRKLVLIRKISNGSRSPRGANTTAILLSIIQTLRFKKENALKGLFNILNNPSGY